MRIRAADSTGCPVPQFVVEPETEADRVILKAFLCFPAEAKEKWQFRLHGHCSTDGQYSSFNFGWAKHASEPKKRVYCNTCDEFYEDGAGSKHEAHKGCDYPSGHAMSEHLGKIARQTDVASQPTEPPPDEL